jgi:hypothetical protein
MDELDTQLAEDLKAQKDGQEPEAGQEPAKQTEPTEPIEETKPPEPKTFDENYVRGLRAENARYRRQLRETEASIPNIVQSEIQRVLYPQGQQGQGYPQAGQPQEYYDPRVDDMLLAKKMGEIKADPYFGELFAEVDEEGRTFEERVLETAVEKQWPIAELDALVFKMEKEKLFGRVKQKGIDEAYKSMSTKAQGSAEKNVSSGKSVEEGEVETIDDAVKKAMKEHGVTSLSELR